MRNVPRFTLFAVMAMASSVAVAQSPTPHVLRGTTTAVSGAPIPGANVFLLESLDGAVTDSAGRFVIRTTAQGSVTIVARRIGFAPATIVVPVDTSGTLALTLSRQAVALAP